MPFNVMHGGIVGSSGFAKVPTTKAKPSTKEMEKSPEEGGPTRGTIKRKTITIDLKK